MLTPSASTFRTRPTIRSGIGCNHGPRLTCRGTSFGTVLGTSPSQALDIELTLGENNLEAEVVNGTFHGSMLAPLVDGTYGLYGDLQNPPNGAFYRGDDSAFVWFIVDNQAPRVAAVDRPGFNTMLSEEDWKDLQFELSWTKMRSWMKAACASTGR